MPCVPEEGIFLKATDSIPLLGGINPETYKKNIKLLSDYNKSVSADKRLDLKSGEATRAVAQI